MIESNDTKHETFEKKRKPHSNKIVFMEKQMKISEKQLLPLSVYTETMDTNG